MTRDERQDASVQRYIETGGCGTLEAVTAYGKTRVALRIIKHMRRDYPARKVLVIVPKEQLKDQWEKLLREWKLDVFARVVIINTAIKNKYKVDLLVLDEIHRYAAESFAKVFECVEYRFILGLTATLARLDRRHTILKGHSPIFDKITIDEAKVYGWVAPYQEFNLGIQLDEKELEEYLEKERTYEKSLGTFGSDFKAMQSCAVSHKPVQRIVAGKWIIQDSATSKLAQRYGWKGNFPAKAYANLKSGVKNFWGGNEFHPYHPTTLFIRAINGLRALRQIRAIIQSHPKKVDLAAEACMKIPVKTITFAELTVTADELSKRLNLIEPETSVAYHTSIPSIVYKGKKLNKKATRSHIIDLMKDNERRVICTAKALDEGVDMPDVIMGIRISGTSSPTQHTQRRGRIVRKFEDKSAIMINIYIKDTKEVRWLTNAQGYGEDIFWVDSVDEILENTIIKTK